jgi:biopolymer transport protein ExbD/biopolymer transport protein TolR
MSSPAARLRALRLLARPESEPPLRPLKSDINVTPLVDVVLVLLIIFMVVTPLIASGVAVDLPRTVHHGRKADDGKDVIISVTWDKRIYVGSQRVTAPREVGAIVSAERRKYPGKTVFLKADARAPYGTVREVMESLHEADIEDMVLGTEEQTQTQTRKQKQKR